MAFLNDRSPLFIFIIVHVMHHYSSRDFVFLHFVLQFRMFQLFCYIKCKLFIGAQRGLQNKLTMLNGVKNCFSYFRGYRSADIKWHWYMLACNPLSNVKSEINTTYQTLYISWQRVVFHRTVINMYAHEYLLRFQAQFDIVSQENPWRKLQFGKMNLMVSVLLSISCMSLRISHIRLRGSPSRHIFSQLCSRQLNSKKFI